jgi:hypothetical protein
MDLYLYSRLCDVDRVEQNSCETAANAASHCICQLSHGITLGCKNKLELLQTGPVCALTAVSLQVAKTSLNLRLPFETCLNFSKHQVYLIAVSYSGSSFE